VSRQVEVKARAGGAVRRADIELPHDIEAGDAFRLIALSCLRHLTLNESALAAGDAEGVHQMRVAARRLRAAIALFRDLFDDRESAPVKARLRWLTAQLAPVRDYDVLIEQSLKSADASAPNAVAFQKLTAMLRQRRLQKLAQAQGAVASERYRELVLDTTRWILGGHWTKAPERRVRRRRQHRLLPLARKLLRRRTRRVQKQLRCLANLPPEQRHELRIRIKKLHYGLQFFGSFFPAHRKRRQKFARLMQRLQARLGELNDARVHQDLARELLEPAPAPAGRGLAGEEAFALGLLQGHEDAALPRLVRRAEHDGRDLARLPRFWR
jgi:triphosphatase